MLRTCQEGGSLQIAFLGQPSWRGASKDNVKRSYAEKEGLQTLSFSCCLGLDLTPCFLSPTFSLLFSSQLPQPPSSNYKLLTDSQSHTRYLTLILVQLVWVSSFLSSPSSITYPGLCLLLYVLASAPGPLSERVMPGEIRTHQAISCLVCCHQPGHAW